MKLTKGFFADPLSSGLARRFILSKVTGERIDECCTGKDYPLLEHWSEKVFSSNSTDYPLIYNGFTFYCVGNVNQINSQLTEYFQLHREDTIDQIFKDQ
jgi:hypothetical protein